MTLSISALDTLFFRDGKPFSMSEDSWADGIFPPYPSVIYGALRSWYVVNRGKGVTEDIINESGGITITSIYYQLSSGIHLPMPLDLVEPKEKDKNQKEQEKREGTYQVIKLILGGSANLSNHPLPELLMPANEVAVDSVDDGLIQIDSFKQYLEGTLLETKIRRLNEQAPPEPKIGIGRDDRTLTADEGKLYRVGMRRTSEFEIMVNLTLPIADFRHVDSFLKLGGEGKAAVIVERGKIARLNIDRDTIELTPGAFKLYLATPAFFQSGWRPNLKKLGIEAELIAAALGKPVHIGGFDIVQKKAKPMLKAVPAGSVFYYRSDEPVDKVLEKLQGKSVSDILAEQGFGIAYIGNS